MPVTPLKDIVCLVLDVDGVLTPGLLPMSATNDGEKWFDTQDGLGLDRATRRHGLQVVVISGRTSPAVSLRAAEVGIPQENLYLGIEDKPATLQDHARRHGLDLKHTAFLGDDVNDLAVLDMVGLFIGPGNATAGVRRRAHRLTRAHGGRGAVREVLEWLAMAKGWW